MADLERAARAVGAGDPGAFRTLVEATSERLYRLALRMTADADDAADVLQEAYIRAHGALARGAWREEAQVQTWLYRVVVHTALNHRRTRARSARPDAPAPAAPASPEVSAEARKLMALVAELPKEQRVAVILKELEGHTAAEIGRILGCSEGAVEQRLVRARETLRRRWSDG